MATDTGGLELLPQHRTTAPDGQETGDVRSVGDASDAPASLRHVCGTVVAGLACGVLLVGGGCLVSLAWETHVLLAVACLVGLLAAAGGGVAVLMTRPRRGRRPNR